MSGWFPVLDSASRTVSLPAASHAVFDGGPRFYNDPWQVSNIIGGGPLAAIGSLTASAYQSATGAAQAQSSDQSSFFTLPTDSLPPFASFVSSPATISTAASTTAASQGGTSPQGSSPINPLGDAVASRTNPGGSRGPVGPAGATGATGAAGAAGAAGADGIDGATPTITIGTVTSGSPAAVTDTGTPPDAVFNFTIPPGDAGAAATIEAGTVTKGTPAAVTNSGTAQAAIFDFTIPYVEASDIPVDTIEAAEAESSITPEGDGTYDYPADITIQSGIVTAITEGVEPLTELPPALDALNTFLAGLGDGGPYILGVTISGTGTVFTFTNYSTTESCS